MQYTDHDQSQSFNQLKSKITSYIRKWPYFLGSIILLFILSKIILRYSIPLYEANTTVMIKSDNNSRGGGNPMADQLDFAGMFSTSRIEDEIEILKSYKLIKKTIDELDLQIEYHTIGNVINSDIFHSTPIQLIPTNDIDEELAHLKTSSLAFILTPNKNDATAFTITANDQSYDGRYGQTLNTLVGPLTIHKKNAFDIPIQITLSSTDQLLNKYRTALNIKVNGAHGSKILILRMSSTNKEKARVFLDELINQYNKEAIEDKNIMLSNSAQFIEDQISLISSDLNQVETEILEYKISEGVTDLSLETGITVQDQAQIHQKLTEISTQIYLLEHSAKRLKNDEGDDLLPIDVGIEEPGLNSQIQTYNNLILDRGRLLHSSTEDNPILININERIASLKRTLLGSFESTIQSNKIKKAEVEKQARDISSRIASSPKQEKKIRGIVREQELKEALYLFLLQKRTEVAISLSMSTPTAKVIDVARASNTPVSPKPLFFYVGALVLGVILPVGFFYIKELLDNKIRSQNDIKSVLPEAVILGEIPNISNNDHLLIGRNDRSVIAEAFRIVNTNLRYLLASNTNKSQIVYVTSTIAKEGKTSVSANIAQILSLSNKKTILVGADLRNPQLKRYFKKNTGVGLSDYLFNNSIDTQEIISKQANNNMLDVIHTGNIPPNPTELLMLPRWAQLMEELKQEYDIVLVDTAPLLLVTDTLVISDQADAYIYVTRARFTEINLLSFAKDTINSKKIKNVGFILNDVKSANYGYGNKYGYGYGNDEKKNIFKKILNK